MALIWVHCWRHEQGDEFLDQSCRCHISRDNPERGGRVHDESPASTVGLFVCWVGVDQHIRTLCKVLGPHVIALSRKRLWMRLTVCKECSIVRLGSVATECRYRHKRLIHRNYGGCAMSNAPWLITVPHSTCCGTIAYQHIPTTASDLLTLVRHPYKCYIAPKNKCYKHNSSRPRSLTYWTCLVYNMPSTCHDCPRYIEIYQQPHVAHGPTVGPPCLLPRFL
jgi:hypothetical protein